LVALESKANPAELAIFGRMVAMHIAATNPLAVDSKGIDEAAIARERDVLTEKAKASGKPANVIEKIVDSGLKTYFKEVTLLEQPYVHEPSKSVAQAVKEVEGKLGSPIAIKGFVRYALGEGVEKQEQDFAAEVAAATRPN
jgi:elongation factor Ts